MNRPSASLLPRGLTIVAGLALLVSLFLTWTSVSLQQLALLAVTANGDLGRLSLSENAWSAYGGGAVALTAVAVLVIATGVLNWRPLVLPAGLGCLAALVFVVVQLGDPPSALPAVSGVALPSSGVRAHSMAGAGETVALIGLILAGIGMWAMLAVAHAQRRRRRRRRRQRRRGGGPGAGGPAGPSVGRGLEPAKRAKSPDATVA